MRREKKTPQFATKTTKQLTKRKKNSSTDLLPV